MSVIDKSIVPENKIGKAVDIENSITVDETEAKKVYEIARKRLLNLCSLFLHTIQMRLPA